MLLPILLDFRFAVVAVPLAISALFNAGSALQQTRLKALVGSRVPIALKRWCWAIAKRDASGEAGHCNGSYDKHDMKIPLCENLELEVFEKRYVCVQYITCQYCLYPYIILCTKYIAEVDVHCTWKHLGLLKRSLSIIVTNQIRLTHTCTKQKCTLFPPIVLYLLY